MVLVSHTCCPSQGFPWLRCALGCSGPSLHTPRHTSLYPEPPCRRSHWSHKCTVERNQSISKDLPSGVLEFHFKPATQLFSTCWDKICAVLSQRNKTLTSSIPSGRWFRSWVVSLDCWRREFTSSQKLVRRQGQRMTWRHKWWSK